MRHGRRVLPLLTLFLGAQAPGIRTVTVTEGTSMSVAASRDGQQLAIDLQGSIWLLPVGGGEARRITDEYNDARQPTWSPDNGAIAFQGFRDGGYDIWAIHADGSLLRKLTWGPYDDREPAWSPDGRYVAFSSDRGGSYDIWTLDLETDSLRQVTRDAGDEYMPTWSPSSDAIAYTGMRGTEAAIYSIQLSTRAERRITATGRYDAPSWGRNGRIVYHSTTPGSSRLEADGAAITGGENAFAFRAGWIADDEIVYVSDGRIRRRTVGRDDVRTIDFRATLRVTKPSYTRRVRNLSSRASRPVRGILSPALSPDAKQVAFIALGDLWITSVDGGTPRNITNDRFLDTEPAWSPDGRYIAWSSDRGGTLLDLWLHDTHTGTNRRLTSERTSAMGAAWSRDGSRIAFLDVDGIWRAASVHTVDVATGKVTKIHDQMFGPGAPTWSINGSRVMVTALERYSARFREGTNQLLSISSAGGDDKWYTPVKHLSIDSRVGAGPAWSPDGTKLALIYEGQLNVVPVAYTGEPIGPPRRVTTEIAHAPTWSGDSRQVLYQSNEKLRLLDLETGTARDVPVNLTYAPGIPSGRLIVHAGSLVDGVATSARTNVDIVIAGNRIERVAPHAAHPAGVPVVDASGLTVMPGLIEFHTHLQKDLGEAAMRAYLGFGITTVRSPGSTPYEAVEDREAIDAGVRIGPRLFVTGYLMEWQRAYYKMSVAVSSDAHLGLELGRAKALGFDMLKSYVRMPDLQQRRIIEFGHAMGVPVASHEVFPSALSGIDGTEHTTGTSRRGYSPKAATLQRSYDDVAKLFAASGMPLTPTLALSGAGLRRMSERDTAFRRDPRFALYPSWLQAQITTGGGAPPGAIDPNAGGQMVLSLMRSGTRIVAGTDTPNAATLHGELLTYVTAGMTPWEALRTATVNSAEMLGLDAGVIAPGKLADLAIVSGSPLEDITATVRVRYTIANGRLYDVRELVKR